MDKNKLPEHASWRVRDAWKANPPCMHEESYCHDDCPYINQCFVDYYDDDVDDEW